MAALGSPAVIGLDRVPEVDAVLARLGLGRLTSAPDLAAFPGRNENWAGTTNLGYRVFVKQLGGFAAGARQRLRRSVAFERLTAGRMAELTPRSLGWDEPARLLVSELIDNAESAADLAASGKLGPGLARIIGDVIGSVHQLPYGRMLPGCLAAWQMTASLYCRRRSCCAGSAGRPSARAARAS